MQKAGRISVQHNLTNLVSQVHRPALEGDRSWPRPTHYVDSQTDRSGVERWWVRNTAESGALLIILEPGITA